MAKQAKYLVAAELRASVEEYVALLGRAVQVVPMKPELKAPESWNYAIETRM